MLIGQSVSSAGYDCKRWHGQEYDCVSQGRKLVINLTDSLQQHYSKDGKFRGIHYFGRRQMKEEYFQPLARNNVEWVVLVPYGWQNDYNSSELRFTRRNRPDRPSREEQYAVAIASAREKGMQVIIKPHIWIGNPTENKWRSDILMNNKAEWKKWWTTYRDFILKYATFSEKHQLPLYCIGAELHSLIKKYPRYWRKLIKDVRKVYSGKLTYAANWYQEFEEVKFWNDLDYIGIQAYFPLTKNKNPSIEELMSGWQKHMLSMKRLSDKYKKPVLFTEIGYKSTANSAIEPWLWAGQLSDPVKAVSTETQANCYEAFFRVFWNKDWFAGALFWEWKGRIRGRDQARINFTPQNKPAEQVLAKWFGELGEKVVVP